MSSVVKILKDKNLINPPSWLPNNIIYETEMGSVAYGVAGESSDLDIYGVCIPRKEMIFPHLAGEIHGFGKQIQRFEQYQEYHIFDEAKKQEYDLSIFNIVKYFQLLSECNPNILDSVFTPLSCIRHISSVGNMIRDNRELFIHKGLYHKFTGYAKSQLHKMQTKTPTGKRASVVKENGYDPKYMYHLTRLLGESEQLLSTGTMDIQRDKEILKSIRRGEWNYGDFDKYFSDREIHLRKLYEESTALPYEPDEEKIKTLLLSCLEHHYGTMENAIVRQDAAKLAIDEIKAIIGKYNV